MCLGGFNNRPFRLKKSQSTLSAFHQRDTIPTSKARDRYSVSLDRLPSLFGFPAHFSPGLPHLFGQTSFTFVYFVPLSASSRSRDVSMPRARYTEYQSNIGDGKRPASPLPQGHCNGVSFKVLSFATRRRWYLCPNHPKKKKSKKPTTVLGY